MKCYKCEDGYLIERCEICDTERSVKWISVKDGLPEPYDFVLVYAHNKGAHEPKPIAIARIVNRIDTWDLLGSLEVGAYMDIEYSIDRDDITHWMPLPKRLKE